MRFGRSCVDAGYGYNTYIIILSDGSERQCYALSAKAQPKTSVFHICSKIYSFASDYGRSYPKSGVRRVGVLRKRPDFG